MQKKIKKIKKNKENVKPYKHKINVVLRLSISQSANITVTFCSEFRVVKTINQPIRQYICNISFRVVMSVKISA